MAAAPIRTVPQALSVSPAATAAAVHVTTGHLTTGDLTTGHLTTGTSPSCGARDVPPHACCPAGPGAAASGPSGGACWSGGTGWPGPAARSAPNTAPTS